MMHLPASVRVYLCASACDMRKGFDGLHALVTPVEVRLWTLSAVICSSSQTGGATGSRYSTGIATASRSGQNAWKKVPTRCRLATPVLPTARSGMEIAAELGAMLSGIDLSHAKRRKRYLRQASKPCKH